MSSVVENQTVLTGLVRSREPHGRTDRWDVLHIAVTQANGVEGKPNLLGESVGHELAVAVDRDELPGGDLRGYRFTGHVRLAGPEVVLALPAGAGAPTRELVPPERLLDDDAAIHHDSAIGDNADDGVSGDAPPEGQWPAGEAGPRPVL